MIALLGRAVDAHGEPIDGGAPLRRRAGAWADAPRPAERRAVVAPLWTGIRAIDAFAPLGVGTRLGLFGLPGAGKSTLLEMVCAGANADAVVVALVGERGREAERWIDRCDERMAVVCATSDRSAEERIAGAEFAIAAAARLRSLGLDVLLVVDSVARYAAALREAAVARGESVGRAGYPPSVFARLARFLEVAGRTADGSITLLATVLLDDEDDPVAQSARSLLDGHIALSIARASRGAFPAVDPVASLSRAMPEFVSPEHLADAATVRDAIARLDACAETRALGMLPGDPHTRRAMDAEEALEDWLRQGRSAADPRATLASLAAFADTLRRR